VAALADLHRAFGDGIAAVEAAARWLATHAGDDPATPGAVSYHLLMLLGIVTGGWQLARAALVASRRLAEGASDAEFYRAKVLTARFYAEQFLPQVTGHLRAIEAGAATLSALPDEQF
jgi:hypothetical protein